MVLKLNLLTSDNQVFAAAREELLKIVSFLLSLGFLIFAFVNGDRKLIWFVVIWVGLISLFRVGRIILRRCSGKVTPDKKAVLITGCDCGFGHLTAHRLAERGWRVFAGCLHPDEGGGADLAARPNVFCFRMDVSSETEVQEAARTIKEKLGDDEMWAVINNAGISKGSEVSVTPMAKVEEVVSVNLMGTVRVTKAFLPLLMKVKGRVVNIASAAGRITMPGFVPYAMSKRAVIAFTDGLRLEVQRHGVSVVGIEPWMYRTRLSNPSGVASHIENQFTASEDHQKKHARRMASNTTSLFSCLMNDDVQQVVDVLEDAVTSRQPRYVYRPGKWYFNAGLWIMNFVPQALVDWVFCEFVFRCS